MKQIVPLIACLALAGCNDKSEPTTNAKTAARAQAMPKPAKKKEDKSALKAGADAAVDEYLEVIGQRLELLRKRAEALKAGHRGEEEGAADLNRKLTDLRYRLGGHIGHGADERIKQAMDLHDRALREEKLLASSDTLLGLKSKIEDYEATVRSAQAQETGERDLKMSDEDKLAAYEQSGIRGVPPSVGAEIIRKARSERSAFWINREIEDEANGYLAIDQFKRGGGAMPSAVRTAILAGAARAQPNDWSRQADELKDEAEAWTTLDGWKRSGVPGLNAQQSRTVLAEALGRYPNDWSMALFIVNDEAKKVTR